MLTEIYIEALLADPKAADQIWVAWDAGEICDAVAAWAWWMTALHPIAAIKLIR